MQLAAVIYLKVPEEALRTRLRGRTQRFDANAALRIDDDVLDSFLASFEQPAGEGEIVVTPQG